MRSSILVPIVIVGVVVAAAAYLVMSKGAETGEKDSAIPQPTAVQLTEQKPSVAATPAVSPTPSAAAQEKLVAGRFSAEEEQIGVDTQVFAVEFTSTGIKPKQVSVKAGDIVIFRNASSAEVRPASESYPFKAPKALKPTEEFQLSFTKTGTWEYGDMLAPGHVGTIVVSK